VLALAGRSLATLGELPVPGRPPLGLACLRGGAAIAVWSDDGHLRSFAAGSGALLDDACSPALARLRPRAVAFAPGGSPCKGFAAGCLGYRLLVGEARSESLRVQARLDYTILSLAYSPDGRRIAVGCDGALLSFSAGSGALLAVLHTVPSAGAEPEFGEGYEGILSLAYSPDGSTIALGDTSGLVRFVWADLSQDAREPLCACPCPVGCATCASALTFAPDGASLAVGCTDGWVRLRGLCGPCAGAVLAELRACPEGRIAALAYEPPGEQEDEPWPSAPATCRAEGRPPQASGGA